MRNVDAERQQERVSQGVQEGLAEHTRIVALGERLGHGRHGDAAVVLGQRDEQLLDRLDACDDTARGDHLVERGERVTSGSAPLTHDPGDGSVVDVEVGIVVDPPHVRLELLRGEELELVVLGAAADGRQHLLRISGGEHEPHVVGRLLERLEQGIGRPGREHVDLVQDVHLGAPGGADGCALDQVADGVDTVVGGRIELEQVEATARLHVLARGALTTRLAALQVLAVQRLGQDASRGRLARAAGTREEVGVALGLVVDRIAQRADHMLLAAHLAEATRTVPAVQGLVGHSGILLGAADMLDGDRSRRGRLGGAARTTAQWSPGFSGGGQAICGTPEVPLRAAAFRP